MSAVEWLLWLATVWTVFLAFVVVDVPALLGRATNHVRQQPVPNWPRHGNAPPTADPPSPHGRHAARTIRSH